MSPSSDSMMPTPESASKSLTVPRIMARPHASISLVGVAAY
jgi:hypothetical protein